MEARRIAVYHFFVSPENIGTETVTITGGDVNHIKNVLRMKKGEKIVVNDGAGAGYCCTLNVIGDDFITAEILPGQLSSTETDVKVVLYQGLPKGDKLETVIQKCTELGVGRIVPVEMKRCVVKLDEKKKDTKRQRWQGIAESAAKQSGREIIPEISGPVSFEKAIKEASESDLFLVPYECETDMSEIKQSLRSLKKGDTLSILIGPEGGFEPSEIEKAKEAGGKTVSLGRRILRTETAAMASVAIFVFELETENGTDA